MALIYTKTLALDKWLLSENNNIIEFTDDVLGRDILYAEFTVGTELPSRVYADPTGVIWYNVKENISPRLSDYKDDADLSSVTPLNIDTFFLDWDKMYLEYVVEVRVVFVDLQIELDTITSNFILGVEQTSDYFREMTIKGKDMFILSPLKSGTNNTHYLKYWEGYPFDIGFTNSISNDTNITTIENLSTQQSTPSFAVTNTLSRLVVSNGTTSVTIEDYLPLPFGKNVLRFDVDTMVELHKVGIKCGTYVKWLNQYGGYNYWLFETSLSSIKTKSNGVINNDFNNIEDSISESRSLGRTSSEQLQVYYEDLNEHEVKILSGLLESPKIYLYLGERYAIRPDNSWIEITLPSSNMITNNFKNKVPSGTIRLSLPTTKTITL